MAAQGKYREAFEQADKENNPEQRVFMQIRKARALHVLGENDKARQIFTKLAEAIIDDKDPAQYAYDGSLVDVEYKLGLKDQAFEHCTKVLARSTQERPLSGVLDHVFPKKGPTAAVWWKFFRQKFPDEEAAASLKRLRELFDGKLTAKAFTDLARDAEQMAGNLKPEERASWLLALGEAAVVVGERDLALTYFEKAADRPEFPAALIRLGDFLAGQKQLRIFSRNSFDS